MELNYKKACYNLRNFSVLLVYDPVDDILQRSIREFLYKYRINCISVYEYPGEQILSLASKLLRDVRKAIFILSDNSAASNLFNYIFSITSAALPRENIITILSSKSILVLEKLQLMRHTCVIETDEESWLEGLKNEVLTVLPCFMNVLYKGTITDSLMFHGLCIQHMQANILGILIIVDNLCLQINLKEFLEHCKKHQTYKTARIIKKIPNLFSASTSLIVTLRQHEKYDVFMSAKHEIAEFASAVIDIFIDHMWSCVCSVKGKYGKEEQAFLCEMFPYISHALDQNHFKSVTYPLCKFFDTYKMRLKSFPKSWLYEDMDKVGKICDAGFFYAGFGDAGFCYYSYCCLTNVRIHDSPLLAHASRFPNCPFVKYILPNHTINQVVDAFFIGKEKPQIAEAVYNKFVDFKDRANSFEKATNNLKIFGIESKQLAEAGFFYMGVSNQDVIQCFNCNVRVYNIPPGQSAWGIHASVSPSCSFIVNTKGKDFLNELQTSRNQNFGSDYTAITFKRKNWDGSKSEDVLFRPW